ncbi:MAG: oligosaccharide flippase family protein [Bacteroidales bacterium]|nr:oligosaccharide flippase family protein [Bacteroidales bacterium]MCL2738483.1 oligosaccharide flippase family protein [Bacteroidales bacterium]
MNHPIKRLAGETAIYGLSTVLARALNFLFVPLYTRMLSTANYGTVTEFMAYIAILQVVLSMGLETGCFRFANKHDQPKQVFSSALSAVLVASLLFWGVCILFAHPVASGLGYLGYEKCIIWLGGILAIDNFTSILFARLRFEHKALKFAVFKTIKIAGELTFNLLLFLALPAYLQSHPDSLILRWVPPVPDFSYVLFAIFLSCVLSLLLFIPQLCKKGVFRFYPALWKKMMYYAIPLMLAGLPGILNDFSDRILFRFLIPASQVWRSELGVFQAGVKLAVLMTLFIQMFRYAAEPFFFAHAKEKQSRELYAKVFNYFTAFAVLVFLGVLLYADVIGLILGRDFRAGISVLPIMLFAHLLLGMSFNVSIWYKLTEKTSMALYITCSGLLVTLVVNLLFMPRFGYMAAAWAHLLSYAVILGLNILLGQKHYPVPYRWKRVGLYLGVGLAIWAISLLLPALPLPVKLIIHTLFILGYLAFVWRIEGATLRK